MINEINCIELNELLKSKAPLVLFDCREQFEWNEGHIKEAILVPLNDFSKASLVHLPSKDTPVFIICRSGNRSMMASLMLLSKGYTQVSNVEGGMIDWARQGFEIVL